jgi:hypothetical protein
MVSINRLRRHPTVVPVIAGLASLADKPCGGGAADRVGIDSVTATALAGLVAVQLVLQHANVDYTVGPLDRWAAWNAGTDCTTLPTRSTAT